MLITTGDIKAPYRILDVVTVIAQQKQKWTGGVDIDSLIQEVKQLLAEKAQSVGGDGIVGVSFHMHPFAGGLGSDGLEVMAFGTVVRTE